MSTKAAHPAHSDRLVAPTTKMAALIEMRSGSRDRSPDARSIELMSIRASPKDDTAHYATRQGGTILQNALL